LENVADPVPGPLEIILRVRACGVCGTDLKIVSGKIPSPIVTLPHTAGHEIAGEVVSIGSGVKNVSVGQNGIVLISGHSPFEENLAMAAVSMIEREAHTHGLTDRIREMIDKSRKSGNVEQKDQT